MRFHQLALGFLFGAAVLLAQGSGSVAPPPTAGDTLPDLPFTVTRSAVGNLSAIQPGVLILDDEKRKEPLKLKLASKVRISADKKSSLAGRKRLVLDDLAAGLYVKVTYRPETGEVVEIRVLKPKTT